MIEIVDEVDKITKKGDGCSKNALDFSNTVMFKYAKNTVESQNAGKRTASSDNKPRNGRGLGKLNQQEAKRRKFAADVLRPSEQFGAPKLDVGNIDFLGQ